MHPGADRAQRPAWVLREMPRDLIYVLEDHFPGLWGRQAGQRGRRPSRTIRWPGEEAATRMEKTNAEPDPLEALWPGTSARLWTRGAPSTGPVVGSAATGLCEDVLGLPAHSSVGEPLCSRKLRYHPPETSQLSVGAGQPPVGASDSPPGQERGALSSGPEGRAPNGKCR